jgi:hypothetical protein
MEIDNRLAKNLHHKIGRFFTKKPRLISVEVRSEYLVFKRFLKHTGNGYIHVVEAERNPRKKTRGLREDI